MALLPQSTVDLVPVNQLPEGGKVVGATVLVVEIVGVFPYVEGE